MSSWRNKKVPILDWVLGIAGACCALYIVVFYAELSERAGAPTLADKVTALIGLLVMLEAARRSLGPVLGSLPLCF